MKAKPKIKAERCSESCEMFHSCDRVGNMYGDLCNKYFCNYCYRPFVTPAVEIDKLKHKIVCPHCRKELYWL